MHLLIYSNFHFHILQRYTAKMALESEEIHSLCEQIIIKESGSKKMQINGKTNSSSLAKLLATFWLLPCQNIY